MPEDTNYVWYSKCAEIFEAEIFEPRYLIMMRNLSVPSFKNFHRTAPYYPQSNGQAERVVGSLKGALQNLRTRYK